MNSFTHGYPFLNNDPYFVVGTGLPDWLSMVNRKVRVRKILAEPFVGSSSAPASQLASGIVQHHNDDAWFHNLPAFVNLNLEFAMELRKLLGTEGGFRPNFVGHVVIEMLIDGELTENNRTDLDRYYQLVSEVDPHKVQNVVNQISRKPTEKLAGFIPGFIKERFLYDYTQDKKLKYRMDRVLMRVKLQPLPEKFLGWLPSARKKVRLNLDDLLDDSRINAFNNSNL